jgi:uncharacterized membrane protein YraQ (UPF0718 family)
MKFDWRVLAAFGVVAIVVLFVAYFRGVNMGKVWSETFSNLWVIIPLIILAFVITMALLQLIPQASLIKWVGVQSGWKGWAIGSVIGAITPGHPVVDFPICIGLLGKGADIGVIVAMLVSSRLWNLQVLTFELSILGWRVTAIRWIATLLFPILAGGFAHLLIRLIPIAAHK